MKKDVTTKYLALFLLIDLVMVGVLLCFFSQKDWWNNWMVMAPNLYMVLGALYCPLMKKNLDKQVTRQTWFYVYKGIKMLLTIAMLVLYILFIEQGAKAFVLITAIAYLLGLIVESYSFMDYLKRHAK
jgi:peptidoglycan/LPS O-acetylase OafA/YrhL